MVVRINDVCIKWESLVRGLWGEYYLVWIDKVVFIKSVIIFLGVNVNWKYFK